MKKLFVILSAWSLAVACCACSEEEDVLPSQREQIVRYLEGTHQPRLVAEDRIEAGSETMFYTTSGNTVYRYIRDYYDPDRVNWPEVTASSRVSITFRMYVFTYANVPDTRLPEFSNDPSLMEAYVAAGTDIREWRFEPLVLEMGRSEILAGLRHALIGCRRGDRVEAYMTYNMAYGDGYFSVIPRQSPIYFSFTVESVE